jgi:multiple sugar transport system substrate-binding protein
MSSSPLFLNRRHLLRGAVLLAGAGALAACGDSGDDSPTVVPTNASGKADFKGTTLQVWSGSTVEGPAKAAAEEWSTETGGTVVVTAIPFAERSIKFAGLISAQDASVDLLYAAGSFVGRFGDRLYENLSDSKYGIDTGAYVPASLPILSAGGGLRGLPVHSEMLVYIYNKTMFAAAGLDPENPPKTWDELYAKAGALTSGSRYGCAIPWTTSLGTGGYYLVFLNSIPGAKLLSEDRTQVLFDTPEGLEAFEAIERGVKAGFFTPALGKDVEDYATGKMFNDGTAASIINFAELWGYAVGSNTKDFPTTLKPEEVGVATVPGVRAGTTGSVNGFEGFGLNKFGKQKAAALHFLQYLTGTKYQTEMNLAKTLPSSNTSVLESAEVKANYPIGPVIAEQGKGNLDRYASPYDWEPPISDALRRLYTGETTAAEAHRSAVAGVKKIVEDYLANG